jgi:hypothetical protein
MPLQATSGAASYDAFGGGVPVVNTFVEDVFSCFLYTGNGTSKTITNGIDLSTKGGLVWVKRRAFSSAHGLIDTARGRSSVVYSNETSAESISSAGTDLTSFNTNGFSIGTNNNVDINISDNTFASWTFRKQPKFFDIQTWTGTGSNRTISHSLGSVPASIWVKRTDLSGAWQVYHRSLANTEYLVLNTTAAKATGATRWNSTTPTSTVFSIGTDATVNASGATYVAYIFAHDAGGFGLTGTDNVISCGTFTSDGSGNATVSLGYEPQWVLVKQSASISAGYGDWYLLDNMRGWTTDGGTNLTNISFNPNLPGAEFNAGSPLNLNSTGFTFKTTDPNWQSKSFIYIAIRRGPMKVPTSGTSVFTSITKTGATSVGQTNTTDFPVDLSIDEGRATNYGATYYDRLRGAGPYLTSSSNVVEANQDPTYYIGFDSNTSVFNKNYGALGATYVNWLFRRAPSFMDVVCYSGDGSVSGSGTRSIPHNLNAVPQLIISKARNQVDAWRVYSETLGINSIVNLSNTAASTANTTNWGTPTSTNFLIKSDRNNSGFTYVTYLFSTCAGVSKVGSYTGTGTTNQIDCGFTGGARFVLIRRTSTGGGEWYVWDSARGIVSGGNDPYLALNNINAEVTNSDYIEPYSAGFEITSSALANINGSGGTFIFLAIA